MNLLDVSRSRKRSPRGWVHIDCPFCEQAGMGRDRGAHLGIHVEYGRLHCFRCGVSGHPPKGWSIVGAAALPPRGNVGDIALPFEALPPGLGEPVSPWAAGNPHTLGARWVHVHGQDAWALPFVGQAGYQVRFAASGKKRNVGVRGPATVCAGTDSPGGVVIVEGWGDALPFVKGSRVDALLGVENAYRLRFDLHHHYWLALDMDAAGRRAQYTLSLAMLRSHVKHYWVRLPCKDPGSSDHPLAAFREHRVTSLADAVRLYQEDKDNADLATNN